MVVMDEPERQLVVAPAPSAKGFAKGQFIVEFKGAWWCTASLRVTLVAAFVQLVYVGLHAVIGLKRKRTKARHWLQRLHLSQALHHTPLLQQLARVFHQQQ